MLELASGSVRVISVLPFLTSIDKDSASVTRMLIYSYHYANFVLEIFPWADPQWIHLEIYADLCAPITFFVYHFFLWFMFIIVLPPSKIKFPPPTSFLGHHIPVIKFLCFPLPFVAYSSRLISYLKWHRYRFWCVCPSVSQFFSHLTPFVAAESVLASKYVGVISHVIDFVPPQRLVKIFWRRILLESAAPWAGQSIKVVSSSAVLHPCRCHSATLAFLNALSLGCPIAFSSYFEFHRKKWKLVFPRKQDEIVFRLLKMRKNLLLP